MARRTYRTLRTGRTVGRRYWFVRGDEWELGTARSWADAVNRISVTGESLVVDIIDAEENPDRKARRAGIKSVRSAMRVVARRRAITVSGHQDGPYLRFTVL
jgi:hypothetical protein